MDGDPEAHLREAAKRRDKGRWTSISEIFHGKREDLNAQVTLVCKGVPSEVDRLLRNTAENYYQAISTFVHLTDLQNAGKEDEGGDE